MPVRSSAIFDSDAALKAWWGCALGRALLAAESELLAAALEDVFGWELLQLGAWGNARELLQGSRTRRQSLIAAPAFSCGADIIAQPSRLPVLSDSIDAVLLPHTLEFAPDPYAILREADRMLVGARAEGQEFPLALPADLRTGQIVRLIVSKAHPRQGGAGAGARHHLRGELPGHPQTKSSRRGA